MSQQILIAYGRYYLNRLGRVGVAGVVLLLAGLTLCLLHVLPQRDATAALERKVAANNILMARATDPNNKPVLSDAQKLERYFASFPHEDHAADALGSVYKSAQHAGVSLDTGEYLLTAPPGNRLKQYRVTLPVKGELIQILAFISGVLKAVPNGALENVSFKRDKIDDPQIDAKLVFEFFVTAAP